MTWSRLRQLSADLERVKKKPLPVKVKQVRACEYASQEAYHQALHDYATQRLSELSERDTPYRAELFLDIIRAKLDTLKRAKSGFIELVFESRSERAVDRLNLWASLNTLMHSIGATYLRSDPTSYLHRPKRQVFTNVNAMYRAEQQGGAAGEGQVGESEQITEVAPEPDPEPITIYYRSYLFYAPDPYFKAYEVWGRHGGHVDGRARFEDLASELPSGQSQDEA